MKKIKYILIIFFLALIITAQEKKVSVKDTAYKSTIKRDSVRNNTPSGRFIDLNGDGINDYAPDIDNDGIPDRLDPNFQKKYKFRHRFQHRDDSLRIEKGKLNKNRMRRGKNR